MTDILARPGPEDHTDPGRDPGLIGSCTIGSDVIGGDSFDGTDALGSFDVLFEGDDLLQALAYASGMYGTSPNGHRTPSTATETAAAGGGDRPPGPPDSPVDGDHPSDDHNGGVPVTPKRCEHDQPMLSTDDLTGWWGPPEPGAEHPVWWCPTWCARTDTDSDGHEIDPTEWVHRSQPHRIELAAEGTTTTPNGEQTTGPVTVTVRAEKHPSRPVRFVLSVGIDGTEHTCTMTVPEAQRIHGFHDLVMDGLTGQRLVA